MTALGVKTAFDRGCVKRKKMGLAVIDRVHAGFGGPQRNGLGSTCQALDWTFFPTLP